MEKILKAIALHSGDSKRASDIYWKTREMNERELAKFVAENDEELRQLLDVKTLSEKGANPEFTSEYFKLKKRGDIMLDPDPKSRRDYYNEEIKGIDYYLDKLGVPKDAGDTYTDDTRSLYTNPDNPEYVGKRSTEEINTYAQEDSQDPRFWLNDMRRAAYDYQHGNRARGYGPNNEIELWNWTKDALQALGAPRMREARLAGRKPEPKDIFGDLAELGLNFIPGIGLVSKAGRIVSPLPRYLAKGVGAAVDYGAVPVGTQLMDMGLYGDGDPRGEWSTGRVLGEAGAPAVGKFMLQGRLLGEAGKMVATGGEEAKKGFMKDVGDFIKNTGFKTGDAIAARQNQLDALAKNATQANIIKKKASNQAWLDAEHYRILDEEAKRLARLDRSQAAKDYGTVLSGNSAVAERSFDVPENAGVYNARMDEAADLLERRGLREDQVYANYRALNEKTPYAEIAVTPDGRLIQTSRLSDDGLTATFEGADHAIPVKEGSKTLEFQYKDPVNARYNLDDVENMYGNPEINRNEVVRKMVENDPLLSKRMSGRFGWKAELGRDAAANAAAYAASREGLVGNVMGMTGDKQKMDEKRANALWNRNMKRLRNIVDRAETQEQRRAYVDAIMNVLNYGLDELPTEIYMQNEPVYKLIATELGDSTWVHPSRISTVPDYPTTSYSSSY